MDMSPPQAPPAISISEQEASLAVLRSIIANRRWQHDDASRLPPAEDAVAPEGRQAFLAAVDAFWNGSTPAHGARQAAWTDAVRRTMVDLATLRERDGTLDPASAALARRTLGEATRNDAEVHELFVGGRTYAGALVLVPRDAAAPRLLFTTDQGWETFDNANALTATLEARLRRMHAAGDDLPGAAARELFSDEPGPLVALGPIIANPMQTWVTNAMARQRERLRDAWAAHLAAPQDAHRDTALVDAIDAALQATAIVDLDSLMDLREWRLAQAVREARLAGVPAEVRNGWIAAWDELAATLAGQDPTLTDEPLSPAEFGEEKLRDALTAVGTDAAPGDITVTVDRTSDPLAWTESLQSLFEGPSPVRVGLIELAWQNMSTFAPLRFSAEDATGTPIATLTDESIRRIIHRSDLAGSYAGYLSDHFRDAAAAPERREQARILQLAWMRFQAHDSRLAYYGHDTRHRGLRADHAQRGYEWIRAVLDSPLASGRRKVEGHDIVVRQLTYRGFALNGILEIGVRSVGSVPTVILYTPGAPDGITFREFDDRAQAAREVLYHPAFRDYLLDRLPIAYANMAANGHYREFAVDGRDWVFGGSATSGYTRTGEPFEQHDVTGDFIDADYDAGVALALRNAPGRSASAANWAWLRNTHERLEWSHVAARTIAGAVSGLFLGPGAAWRFYDSVKAGDSAQAFVDFAELYVHALAFAPVPPASRPVLAPRGVAARQAIARPMLRTGASIRPAAVVVPPSPMPSRYAARGLRPKGQPNGRGLYTIQGHTYLEHDGVMYGARWDAAFDTVRLQRPGSGATGFGPAVVRAGEGRWVSHAVGLRGGSGRGPGRAGTAPSANDTAGLAPWEHVAFRRQMDYELHWRVPNATSRRDLLRQVEEGALMGTPPALYGPQLTAWREATRSAFDQVIARRTARRTSGQVLDLRPGNATVSAPTPVAPAPPGYTVVAPVDYPRVLHVIDNRPYRSSRFQRQIQYSQRRGAPYSNQFATLASSTHAPGVSGARLTTLGQNASRADLLRYEGVHATQSTFVVAIDGAVLAHRAARPNSNLQLLRTSDGMGFILRRLDGKPVEIYGGEFLAPVTWRGS
jgi:hypothetical protein